MINAIFFLWFAQETLTGFKWMGNRAKDLLDQGKNVLFAFEEAIGMYKLTHTHWCYPCVKSQSDLD